jgi:hypothetical protein
MYPECQIITPKREFNQNVALGLFAQDPNIPKGNAAKEKAQERIRIYIPGKEQEKTQNRTRTYMGAVPGNGWGDFQRVPPTFPKAGKIGWVDETSTLLLQISSSSLEPATLQFPTQSEIRSPVWKCESCKVETKPRECHNQSSIFGEDFAEVPICLTHPPRVERKPREEKRGDPGKTSVAPSIKLQPQTVGGQQVGA